MYAKKILLKMTFYITIHCREARLKPPQIKDPVRFVVSTLVNGLGLQQSSEFLLENGIIPPKKKDCYKIQKQLLPKIEACAHESCKKAFIQKRSTIIFCKA